MSEQPVQVQLVVTDKRARARQTPVALGWDGAIEEAKRQIGLAERRIQVLKGCISTFQRLRDDGEIFPGASTQ